MRPADSGAPHYKPGGTWGICDRCAFRYRLAALQTEWTGLKVCRDCYDPRPVDLSPIHFAPEGVPVRGARPDPGDTLGDNTTTAEDL